MILCATFVLSLAVPQVSVSPYRAALGDEVVVHAEKAGKVLVGVEVTVELPDGAHRAIGVTDERGDIRFVPDTPGGHVFGVEVDGLRMLAPSRVVKTRPRWLVAVVCVPLGLALLWRNFRRARDRRGR